ncbi:Palmitoyltransferase ZDHHC18, partial [Ophiophagus hannah]
MLARHSSVFLLTVGLIVVTSGLFFAFDCPFLAHKLTMAIPIIAGILFFFVISCLLQTSFRDPGILPRATPSEAADLEKWIDNLGTSTYRPPARTMEVVINKYMVKLKYCYTCKMFRPPRTSHCSVCDNCVVWSIFGLSGFHTYLIASNLTTNEDLKGAWSNKRGSEFANPYSHKSVLTNCCAVLCGPFYPSLIDRRGFVQADAGTPSTPKGEIPSFGTKSDASMV